jgi:WD40 repeat protein
LSLQALRRSIYQRGGFGWTARLIWEAVCCRPWPAVTFVLPLPPAAAAANGQCKIWNAQTAKPLTQSLCDVTAEVHDVRFSPDESSVLVVGTWHSTALWKIAQREKIFDVPIDVGHSAAFSSTGDSFVVTGLNWENGLPKMKTLIMKTAGKSK